MGNRKTPGLTKRGGIWHIDKQFRGNRICESTGSSNQEEAESFLAKRMTQIREAQLFGLRPDRTFRAAATKFLKENQDKRSIADYALHLRQLDGFIGDLELKQVHLGSLQRFIDKRRLEGVKTKTLNAGLATVRRILNLAANEWRDEKGMTWLESAPRIKLFPVLDSRPPYPLSAEEQKLLFEELPHQLSQMAMFKVNTGCREQEVCQLKWEYERKVPELGTSVFRIPGRFVKNGDERLVVLNRCAKSVIESVRGDDPMYVFVRKLPNGQKLPFGGMNNTAWKSARERAADRWEENHMGDAPIGFRRTRVHDLKHTFGRRLREANVSFEDRQDLLGHRSGRITTHYSRAELASLISAAEKVCAAESRKSHARTNPIDVEEAVSS